MSDHCLNVLLLSEGIAAQSLHQGAQSYHDKWPNLTWQMLMHKQKVEGLLKKCFDPYSTCSGEEGMKGI